MEATLIERIDEVPIDVAGADLVEDVDEFVVGLAVDVV